MTTPPRPRPAPCPQGAGQPPAGHRHPRRGRRAGGLAAAIAARQHGLEVMVADGAAPPIDKACGEGVMPNGVAALRQSRDRDPCGGVHAVPGHPLRRPGLDVEARFRDERWTRRPPDHAPSLLLERAEALGVRPLWRTPVRGPDATTASPLPRARSRLAGSSGPTARHPGCVAGPGWAGGACRGDSGSASTSASAVDGSWWRSTGATARRHSSRRCPRPRCASRSSRAIPASGSTASLRRARSLAPAGWTRPPPPPASAAPPSASRRLPGGPPGSGRAGRRGIGLSRRHHGRGPLHPLPAGAGAREGPGDRRSRLATRAPTAASAATPALMTRLLLAMDRSPWLRRRALHALAAKPSLFAQLLALHVGSPASHRLAARSLCALGWQLLIA